MAGELVGVEELLAALRAQAERVRETTPDAALQAAHLVETASKRLLGLTSHKKGTPTPSAPGSPPSLVSGNLRRSIRVRQSQPGTDRWAVTVGPSMVYGRIQELGGEAGHGAILPARPYIAPAWTALERKIGELLEQTWRDALD